MKGLIDPDFRTRSTSLLGRQHFQVAYVTNDLATAKELMGRQYAIKEFLPINGVPLPFGGTIDIALAWAGNVNIELIQGSGNPASFYQAHLPGNSGFEIAFHHFGYVIPDLEAWAELQIQIAASGKEVMWQGEDPNGLSFIYARADELGHFLEYVRPDHGWIELFASLPRF